MKSFILFNFFTFFLFVATLSSAQNALHFDRSGDYVQTTFPGIMGTSDRTFEAWIYVDIGAAASNLCILDYGTNAAGDRNTFAVSGTRKLSFTSGGTNANISSTATNVIPEGVWTHVAFVLDNRVGFLYVNATLVGTGSLTGVSTPAGFEDLKIGQRVAGGSILFEGRIDDVRIWNTARTQSEIEADTNSAFCPLPPNLVAYYNFDQGTAGGNNTGLDSLVELVSSNNGTLNSFALTGNTSNWVPGKSLVSNIDLTNDTIVACRSYASPSGKYTWTASGTYIDTLTSIHGCDSVLEIELTVNHVVASATLNQHTIIASPAAATYQWLDCDNNYQPISGETSLTYLATANGNFAVRVEKDGCVDTSSCIAVTTVGLNDITSTSFAIYPNPSKGDLLIEGSVAGTLSILNTKGAVVYETTIEKKSNKIVSLPSSLGNGIYLVHFQSNEVLIKKKLLLLRE